jgi:hypothetical protein
MPPRAHARYRGGYDARQSQFESGAGGVLYEPPSPCAPLHFALEDSLSISSTGEDDKILAVREANEFTAEMSVISGKRSILKARVAGDGCGRARGSLLRFKDLTANQPA